VWLSRAHFEASMRGKLSGWQRQRAAPNEAEVLVALQAAVARRVRRQSRRPRRPKQLRSGHCKAARPAASWAASLRGSAGAVSQ
jgi:hypothetical protein